MAAAKQSDAEETQLACAASQPLDADTDIRHWADFLLT